MRACASIMEISSNSKVIKKKCKKKKTAFKNVVILNPSLYSGMNNWEKMQEILGPVKSRKDSSITNKAPTAFKVNNSRQNNNKRTSKCFKVNSPMKKTTEVNSENSSHVKHAENKPFERNNMTSDNSSNHSGKVAYPNTDDPSVNKNNMASDNFSDHSGKAVYPNTNDPKINNKIEDMFSSISPGMSYAEKLKRNLQVSPSKSQKQEVADPENKKLTKAIAMDCEMVGTGPNGEDSVIARVSIVNSHGDCLYDEYVKPKLKVTDYRTPVSGIRPCDLKKGKDLFEVQKDVTEIIKGRILVGHSIKHDLSVLFLDHPRSMIRDTAYYKPFRQINGGGTPSLKKLAANLLGCDIQSGEHNSVEDAQATMLVYLSVKNEWERMIKSQRKKRKKPKFIENNMEE